MIGTFTIEAVDDSGVLMWTGKNGAKAVLLFPSRDRAEEFIGTQCNLVQLRVVELTPESIELWVAKVQRYGAREAILNPSPDGDLKKSAHAKPDAVLRVILGNADNN
jgi:hypothetical protein